MILTNNTSLHPLVLKGCEVMNQPPKADVIRCTELLNPPLIKNLLLKHYHEITQDVSELAWSVSGSAVHRLFERLKLPGVIQDFSMRSERFEIPITGTLDIWDLNTKEILDIKNTSVWKIVYRDFEKFYEQLNVYRWLISQYGVKIDKLTNILLLKDWRSRDAKNDSGGYPKSPIVSIDVPVWTMKQTDDFVAKRIEVYKTQPWTICTPEERWQKVTYAVMEAGKKRAITNGVKSSYEEAKQFMLTQKGNLTIEKRGGECLRCLQYCPVKDWCEFGKKLVAKE